MKKMRKMKKSFLAGLLFVFSAQAFAEGGYGVTVFEAVPPLYGEAHFAPEAAQEAAPYLMSIQIQTDLYKIIYERGIASGEELEPVAMQVAVQMEALFEAFNHLFWFNPAAAPEGALPMTVRVFTDTEGFESHLASRLAPAGNPAVYLHFEDAAMRELVINLEREAAATAVFPHQAFVQFLRAFIPHPPAWMLEGFAVFFSGLSFDEGGELVFSENLGWLPVARADAVPPADILFALDGHEEFENFTALAWSLASFLMNSTEDYMRALTDSFMTLSPAAGATENTSAAGDRLLFGKTMGQFTADFRSHLDSRRTFAELMGEGRLAFYDGDEAAAVDLFARAAAANPANPIPFFYLGLLAFNAGDFEQAELFYLISIGNGADEAHVLFSLGVNAMSAGRNEAAADFLSRAADLDPQRFGESAQALLSHLSQ